MLLYCFSSIKCQEALRRLGFYSGEEYMEFSSFCSGPERAVKDLAGKIILELVVVYHSLLIQ